MIATSTIVYVREPVIYTTVLSNMSDAPITTVEDDRVTEFVMLPRRVTRQPMPKIYEGGDCGACVLSGLTGWPVEEVYERLHPKKMAVPFSYRDMVNAATDGFYTHKVFDRYTTTTPMWPQSASLRAWGDAAWSQSLEWRDWLRMAFDAGYYAIAQVKCDPDEGPQYMTDHWVLYTGLRTLWEKPKGEAPNSGTFELLVSDSSLKRPHEDWFDMSEHLKTRGGFEVILVRPV